MDDSLITHVEEKARTSLIAAVEKSELVSSEHSLADNNQSKQALGGKEKRYVTM